MLISVRSFPFFSIPNLSKLERRNDKIIVQNVSFLTASVLRNFLCTSWKNIADKLFPFSTLPSKHHPFLYPSKMKREKEKKRMGNFHCVLNVFQFSLINQQIVNEKHPFFPFSFFLYPIIDLGGREKQVACTCWCVSVVSTRRLRKSKL